MVSKVSRDDEAIQMLYQDLLVDMFYVKRESNYTCGLNRAIIKVVDEHIVNCYDLH